MKTTMHYKLFLILSFFVVSCASENEKASFEFIEQIFDCKVSYTKGFETNASGKKNYLGLTLSGGEYINQGRAEFIGSKTALLLYQKLPKDETKKYTHFRVVVEQNEASGGLKKFEQDYPVDYMAIVSDKYVHFENIERLLMTEDFSTLVGLLDERYRDEETETKFVSYAKNIYEQNTGIKSVNFNGISPMISKEADQIPLIEYYGTITWNNDGIGLFSFSVPRDGENNSLHNLFIK